jgi:hypothetical protein
MPTPALNPFSPIHMRFSGNVLLLKFALFDSIRTIGFEPRIFEHKNIYFSNEKTERESTQPFYAYIIQRRNFKLFHTNSRGFLFLFLQT